MISLKPEVLEKTYSEKDNFFEFQILSSSKTLLVWLVIALAKTANSINTLESCTLLFLYPFNKQIKSPKEIYHSTENKERISIGDETGHLYDCELSIDENGEKVTGIIRPSDRSAHIFFSQGELNGFSKDVWKPNKEKSK